MYTNQAEWHFNILTLNMNAETSKQTFVARVCPTNGHRMYGRLYGSNYPFASKFDKHEFIWSTGDLRSNAFDARMYLVFTLLFKTTGIRCTLKIMNLSSRKRVFVCFR